MVESGCGCWGLCWFPEGHSLAWGVGIAFAHGSRMEHLFSEMGPGQNCSSYHLKGLNTMGFFFFVLTDKQPSKEKKKKKKKSKEVLFNSSDLLCYPPAWNRGGLLWCPPGTWWTPFHAHILQL